MSQQETIREPARDIPILGKCDVLVVGGGAAAIADSSGSVATSTILSPRRGPRRAPLGAAFDASPGLHQTQMSSHSAGTYKAAPKALGLVDHKPSIH